MSERKVLNKYNDPTFDPSKLPKNKRGQQVNVRMMLPMTMRCITCERRPVWMKSI